MHICPIHSHPELWSENTNFLSSTMRLFFFKYTEQAKEDKIEIIFPAHLSYGYIHLVEIQP